MAPKFVKLLLEVLHYDPARPSLDSLTLLTSTDWNQFITESIEYRVAFQVHEYLSSDLLRLELVPQGCLDRLTESINMTVVNNLRQQANLNKLLSACQAINLPGGFKFEVQQLMVAWCSTSPLRIILHAVISPQALCVAGG